MNLMKKGFAGVLAAFAVSALSPVLIPCPVALDGDGNLNGAGYAAGVMFWLGMIAGIAGYILLYLQYKKKRQKRRSGSCRPRSASSATDRHRSWTLC